MEIVQSSNRKKSNSDCKIPSQRNTHKRRLSVSIVESEGCRSKSNDQLSTNNWKNENDDDPNGSDHDRKRASHMHEMMTQDCIEWDEGRHNIDLRKLADPNFQTPLVLYGTHPTILSTTGEKTAGSISPKDDSLLRLALGSTMSHNDSQSPVPRRRQLRRRESLDVIARHIPNKTLNTDNTTVSIDTALNSKENLATVAIVSTERHVKPYGNTQKPNGVGTLMQDVTNIIPYSSKCSVTSATRDGTTDFADLLYKIQTNTVVNVVANPSSNFKITDSGTEVVPSENQIHQATIPAMDKTVHHPSNISVHNTQIKSNEGASVGNASKPVVFTDDEFDDVTFSSDDLATIDALIHTIALPKTSTINKINEEHIDATKNVSMLAKLDEAAMDEDIDPFGDIPDVDIEAILTEKNKESVVTEISEAKPLQLNFTKERINKDNSLTTTECQPCNPSVKENKALKSSGAASTESDDDQFDDLPDFDVEAFVSKQEFVLPTMTCTANDDDDEFPDVDFASLDLDVYVASKISEPPPSNAPMRNRRRLETDIKGSTFLTCSRYKVLHVADDASTYTKTVSLAEWTTEMLQDEDEKSRLIHHSSDQKWNRRLDSENKWKMVGVIYLRGEWYYTRLQNDDTIHVVSLTGRFCTDQLPIVFHTCPPMKSDTDDDLLLIVHPDMLLTPTIISETVSCSRRAVLKNRLGATGLTSKAALDGTMRHALFEATMKAKDFSNEAAIANVKSIVRENAESLLACNVSTREAENEIIKFLPQLQRFADEYTDFRGPKTKDPIGSLESHGAAKSSNFLAKSVEAVEEPIISPELGLKGNIDMLVQAISTTSNQSVQSPSLMGIELKTGHHQNAQNIHVAQLALYVIMLQSRFGAKAFNNDKNATSAMESGVLLYMNNDSIRAIHIAPVISEIKSLIGMRNLVAIETITAQRPRGVRVYYEASGSEPSKSTVKVDLLHAIPPELPELLPNSFSCKKCYSNRECMMYAAASRHAMKAIGKEESHRDLMQHFTDHLVDEEFDYFIKWDRLIDLEADASSSLIARSWLRESTDIENEVSTSIASLSFDPNTSSPDAVLDESWFAVIGFQRSQTSSIHTPLSDVGFEPGCRVVIGTDSRSVKLSSPIILDRRMRPQMHIARGSVYKVTESHIFIQASRDDLTRVEICSNSALPTTPTFRMDKENLPTGITTLRQNLVNLFTADKKAHETPGSQVKESRLSWLRDVLIRLRQPVFDRSIVKLMFTPTQGLSAERVPGCNLEDLYLEFSNLNQDQKAAVEQVFTAQDYTLVQGLPGSGKTSTIAFVVRLLAAHGKRVLVTSYTHTAVDNVLLKLIECGVSNEGSNGQALVRVGKKTSCHAGVLTTLASTIALQLEAGLNTQQHATPSSEYLRIAISNARIVGVTALTIPRSPLLFNENFDVVIVDEAGQISQPAVIGALLAADRFILVGDHMQLPPLVVSELAGKAEYGESMLKRLADKHPDSVSQLTYQYRMHEDICQLSNDIVYKGKLKCANKSVAKKILNLNLFPSALESAIKKDSLLWLSRAIDPSNAVIFLDTDRINVHSSNPEKESICSLESSNNRRAGGSLVNATEASIVNILIGGLLACGVDTSSIGVVSPFRAQLRLLDEHESIQNWKKEGIEVSTIDRFQGRDKSVIILSFVRSNTKGKVGHLLEDSRRLNVAVTRAKYKLIMIGSYSTLYKGSDVLKVVLDRVAANNHLVELPSDTLS